MPELQGVANYVIIACVCNVLLLLIKKTDASVEFQDMTLSVMEGNCISPVLLLTTTSSLAVDITVEVTASGVDDKGLGECVHEIHKLESFVAMPVTNRTYVPVYKYRL